MKKLRDLVISEHYTRALPTVDMLSTREREIARFAASGFANKVIALRLNITEGTVKVHLHKVYQKLGIKDRSTLASLIVESLENTI